MLIKLIHQGGGICPLSGARINIVRCDFCRFYVGNDSDISHIVCVYSGITRSTRRPSAVCAKGTGLRPDFFPAYRPRQKTLV